MPRRRPFWLDMSLPLRPAAPSSWENSSSGRFEDRVAEAIAPFPEILGIAFFGTFDGSDIFPGFPRPVAQETGEPIDPPTVPAEVLRFLLSDYQFGPAMPEEIDSEEPVISLLIGRGWIVFDHNVEIAADAFSSEFGRLTPSRMVRKAEKEGAFDWCASAYLMQRPSGHASLRLRKRLADDLPAIARWFEHEAALTHRLPGARFRMKPFTAQD